jgi:hypothetical protein
MAQQMYLYGSLDIHKFISTSWENLIPTSREKGLSNITRKVFQHKENVTDLGENDIYLK